MGYHTAIYHDRNARNMKDLTSVKLPTIAILLITALSFSLVHYLNTLLMIGTFFLALAYTSLYLKNRNLIVMGIYHGWIGAFFYATILARDPWQELFGHLNL